jgi:hypothetical protein
MFGMWMQRQDYCLVRLNQILSKRHFQGLLREDLLRKLEENLSEDDLFEDYLFGERTGRS